MLSAVLTFTNVPTCVLNGWVAVDVRQKPKAESVSIVWRVAESICDNGVVGSMECLTNTIVQLIVDNGTPILWLLISDRLKINWKEKMEISRQWQIILKLQKLTKGLKTIKIFPYAERAKDWREKKFHGKFFSTKKNNKLALCNLDSICIVESGEKERKKKKKKGGKKKEVPL